MAIGELSTVGILVITFFFYAAPHRPDTSRSQGDQGGRDRLVCGDHGCLTHH